MHATREVAVRLVEEGAIQITQKGQAVDPHTFKGPIRLRLVLETKTLGVSKVTAELPSLPSSVPVMSDEKKVETKGKVSKGTSKRSAHDAAPAPKKKPKSLEKEN
jgi:hypothetical protein